jgi:hypothetical protein
LSTGQTPINNIGKGCFLAANQGPSPSCNVTCQLDKTQNRCLNNSAQFNLYIFFGIIISFEVFFKVNSVSIFLVNERAGL